MADLREMAWQRIPEHGDPQDWISRNFQRWELNTSDLAARRGIDNRFATADELRSAVHLCREIMQPVREKFGRYSPNSVYRSQALERALKNKPASWVSRSQHTLGQACDIEVHSATNLRLARWIAEHLRFDQLILECYSAEAGPYSGWVHVSLKPPGQGRNRAEVLSYVRDPATGRYVYVNGLVESPPGP